MSKVFLFDWGDTLMVDLPNTPGHMKDWPRIEEVTGANQALKKLSEKSKLFVATGSKGTSEELMQLAFLRTTFSSYLSGYFCPDNIGYEKPSKSFYKNIADKVNCEIENITMIGDNLERDILPAISIGMSAIWLNKKKEKNVHHVQEISCLSELCT